jgi:hypothetical protein
VQHCDVSQKEKQMQLAACFHFKEIEIKALKELKIILKLESKLTFRNSTLQL